MKSISLIDWLTFCLNNLDFFCFCILKRKNYLHRLNWQWNMETQQKCPSFILSLLFVLSSQVLHVKLWLSFNSIIIITYIWNNMQIAKQKWNVTIQTTIKNEKQTYNADSSVQTKSSMFSLNFCKKWYVYRVYRVHEYLTVKKTDIYMFCAMSTIPIYDILSVWHLFVFIVACVFSFIHIVI